MSILKEFTLDEMHAILLDLLKKLDPNKPVYYFADPNIATTVQPTTKEAFETFINDAVIKKKKIGDTYPKDRMVDLIYRISGGVETIRDERVNNMKTQIENLL